MDILPAENIHGNSSSHIVALVNGFHVKRGRVRSQVSFHRGVAVRRPLIGRRARARAGSKFKSSRGS